ncbi:LapB repeat-containing protein [Listeria costaricensis]|uniref:LapB repeat-containing protein n=1 Tax=Listeria costaricensis TaxID=2026604 RepID=UPI000C083B9E|nr:LapB repeat-containing protein [Listeria costaricensis]
MKRVAELAVGVFFILLLGFVTHQEEVMAASVGPISPDDLSPEISDNRFQSATGKILPSAEVDMSISDQNNGKLAIDEDYEVTSDGDYILIGTVQGQYIQGVPILNEKGQLNTVPNRDMGVILRVDKDTKKVLWARVVNDESGNYSPTYGSGLWQSSYKAITKNPASDNFYVGGEVVNYYGNSGGSTLIVKSINADGNFQISHKSFVNYNIPDSSDLTYSYFMDIEWEGSSLTMAFSSRYAPAGKQFTRYKLDPSSFSLQSYEYNPLDDAFWSKYQRTDIAHVANKGEMVYLGNASGTAQMRMSFQYGNNQYTELSLFDAVPEVKQESSPYIFLEQGEGDTIYAVLATSSKWYIALVDASTETVIAKKEMAMDSSTSLTSVTYSAGKGLLLGGSTQGKEDIFNHVNLTANNGYYLSLDSNLNLSDVQVLVTAQDTTLQTILSAEGDQVEGFFKYEGQNNDGYIQNVTYPSSYTVNPKGGMLYTQFEMQPAPVLDTGNPIMAFYTGERVSNVDEMAGVSAWVDSDGEQQDITSNIIKNEFDLFAVGVEQQLYQVESLPDSGNITTGSRNIQFIHKMKAPSFTSDYLATNPSFNVGDTVDQSDIWAFSGLDSANSIDYVVTAVTNDTVTLHATIHRTEGTRSATPLETDITVPKTNAADSTAIIDVTSAVVASGKYQSLQEVRDEGHFHIFAYDEATGAAISPDYVTIEEDPADPLKLNVPGVYNLIAKLDPASGYVASEIQLQLAVVDTAPPEVTNIDLAAYNPTSATVSAMDDVNGDGIYKMDWQIKDQNDLVVLSGEQASAGTQIVQTEIPLDVSTLADGAYKFEVTAADRIGHQSASEAKSFTIDRTAPVITTNKTTITYEAYSEKSAAEFLTDIAATTDDGSPVTSDFDQVVDMQAVGSYTVTLNAQDEAGNLAMPVEITVVVKDTVPPTVTMDSAITYNQNANRTESEFLTDIHAEASEPARFTTTFDSAVNFSVPGVYTVQVVAEDISGNQSPAQNVTVTILDTVGPVITADPAIIYEKGTTKNEADFLTDIHATTDDGSPITSDFGTAADLTKPGTYEVTLNAKDTEGNEADPVIVEVTVKDTIAPVISADDAITYEKGTEKTEAEFLADISAKTDDGSAITTNFDPNVLRQVGEYTVTLNAIDESGNYAEPKTVTITVEDTTAPVISVDKTTITYERGTTKEPLAFLVDIGARTDDGSLVVSDFAKQVDMNTAGSYTVTLEAVDLHGNKAVPVQITVVVEDTEKPVITADSTITYNMGTARTEAEFLQDIHAATNDGSPITTDYDPAILKTEGTYTVTLQAMDASGNQAEPFKVTVSVVDRDAPIINADDAITYERGTKKTESEFLADVHATTDDGSAITTDFDPTDLETAGTYTVTLRSQDQDGNQAEPVTVKMTVQDTVPPVITAETSITYERGSQKTEAGFLQDIQAKTDDGSPVTSDFATVDLSKTGVYQVTLNAEDASGNKAQPLLVTVLVEDTVAPVITTDKTTLTVERGTDMSEADLLKAIGATTDDGSAITTDFDPAMLDTAGTYTIHLHAVDASGNQAETVSITLVVQDTVPPVIQADKTITYTEGDSRTVSEFLQDIHATTDDGSKVTTDFDPAILKKPGTYTVHLTAKDASGNVAQTFDVTVIVKEKAAPPDNGGNGVPPADSGGSSGGTDASGTSKANPIQVTSGGDSSETANNQKLPASGDQSSAGQLIAGLLLVGTAVALRKYWK